MYRPLGIVLTAEKNYGKSKLGDRPMKAVRPVIASNGSHFLQMRSVGPHSTLGRKKDEAIV